MPTSNGWAVLGNKLAGGQQLNSELAYDQGQALGARTYDAMEQAKQRVMQNSALEQMDGSLQGVPGLRDTDPDGPAKRRATVALYQANKDPETVFKGVGEAFNNDRRMQAATAADAGDSDKAARALFPIGTNDQIIRPAGEFQTTDVLHPSAGPTVTPLGEQLAGVKMDQQRAQTANSQSEAALHADQMAHPEKYRLVAPVPTAGATADGSQPIANETHAQLAAAGLAPPPAPGRALAYMGGEEYSRRMQWLALHPDQNPALHPELNNAPAASAAPTAAPPGVGTRRGIVDPGVPPDNKYAGTDADNNAKAVMPGQKPAVAPKDDGIKLPTETPVEKGPLPITGQSADYAAFATRRTALGDLARKNGTGGQNDAINRVAGHLDVYKQLMDQSGNTDFVAGNALKNWFRRETGKAWPGQAGLAAQILGTEIVKSMANNGIGTGEERMGLANDFSKNNSQQGATGIIRTAEDLLREQAVATNQRITAAGIKDFYGKYLTETARRHLRVGEFEEKAPGAAKTGALSDDDIIAKYTGVKK